MDDATQPAPLRTVEVLGEFGAIDPTLLRWADGFEVVDRTRRRVPFHMPAHYTDAEWLGVGAQGAVVKAVDGRTGTAVAIKLLCCREQPNRVLREIRAMGRWVRHSNLTCAEELYQARDAKGTLWVYIVMPLMTGSLEDWLRDFRKRKGEAETIPPDTVAMIGYQALRGLLYLHSGGVHHRDLSPRNILYTPLPPDEPLLKTEPVARRRRPPSVTHFLDAPTHSTAAAAFAVCPALTRLAARNGWDWNAGPAAFAAENERFSAFLRDALGFFGYQRHSQRRAERLARERSPAHIDPSPAPPSPDASPAAPSPHGGVPCVPARLRVAISDFGLSRVGREEGDDAPDGGNALTDYIVTRYYRAPELILGHGLGQYSGEKVDVWSLGCVLGELVCPKFGPFLTGRTSKEQIEWIFLLCGVPDAEEVAPFATASAVEYVRSLKRAMNGKRVGTDFSTFFKSATPDCVDALKAMLVLAPNQRRSASELLDMPFFVHGARLCGAEGEPVATGGSDYDDGPLSPRPAEGVNPGAGQAWRLEQLIMAEVEGHRLRADRMRRFAARSAASQTAIGLLMHACARYGILPSTVDNLLHFIPDHCGA